MTVRLAVTGMALGSTLMASVASHAETTGSINAVDGVALHGFDAVAYFEQHKAVKGSPAATATYGGVTYEFATKEHAATFQKDPAKYLPTFNGFCPTAASEGVKADADPHEFVVYKGKLNVFYSEEALAHFVKDEAGVTAKATGNWPEVQKQTTVIR